MEDYLPQFLFMYISITMYGVYSSRAFSSQAPIAWNSLPATLRAERNSEKFKKNFKTYLFTL